MVARAVTAKSPQKPVVKAASQSWDSQKVCKINMSRKETGFYSVRIIARIGLLNCHEKPNKTRVAAGTNRKNIYFPLINRLLPMCTSYILFQ